MLNLILIGMLAFIPMVTVHAFAADNELESRFEPKIEHLSEELQLNSDQKAKLEAIFNERHEKIRAIREETQKKIKQVLTEQQMLNWESIRKQRFGKHPRSD